MRLCLKVQPLSSSDVKPGGKASYAIWVWSAGGAASSVSVTVSGNVAGRSVTPAYTVCPAANKQVCTVGGIGNGRSDELTADLRVPSGTAGGKQATLTATAKSGDAAAPSPASASVTVATVASTAPTPTPTIGSSFIPVGAGTTLPAGYLPTVPGSSDVAASLPGLPSPQSSLGGLFPTVAPGASPTPTGYSASLPNARNPRLTDAAATFPFSARLIGGEIAGLAVLAAAVAIGVVRFSLRRPRQQRGKDAAS